MNIEYAALNEIAIKSLNDAEKTRICNKMVNDIKIAFVNVTNNYLRMGGILECIFKTKLYKHHLSGKKTWEEFVKEVFPFKVANADHLRRVYCKFGEHIGDRNILYKRLLEILPIANEDNMENLLDHAARLPRVRWENRVLLEKGLPNRDDSKSKATFKKGKINIALQKDIFNRVEELLNDGHHFYAVEEAYKIVRKKLKDITGKEKATDAFCNSNYEIIFGRHPVDDAEKNFFEGVKFLHMSIQFLRNEKAHSIAYDIDKNLAIHYISLASLAYDLITRK